MTNRLVITWDLDGLVHEQKYYCSTNPIDINNLPAPKAVLAGDVRTHTDTDILVDQKYYIRIGSVRNSTEKVSDQISITAKSTKNIALFTSAMTNAATVALKTTLESYGHSVTILDAVTLTVAIAQDYDLIIGFRVGTGASSTNVRACVDAGIPVLCGQSNLSSGGVSYSWSTSIGLSTSSPSHSNSTTTIRYTADVGDILLNVGITTLPMSVSPYTDVDVNAYITNLASGAVSLAIRGTTTSNHLLAVAEKGVADALGGTFNARVAYFGTMSQHMTQQTKDVLNQLVYWLCD